jgi:ubiquinone/menaquinone biosynthesis C-methylase UbiE
MTQRPDPLQCFTRQALRTALVPEWLQALDVRAGDCVADLGCGAGYVAIRAAQQVGPGGTVHALDADPEAVTFLDELARLHGLGQIRSRVQQLGELQPLSPRPGSALLSMVLHHVDRPVAMLRRIADVLEGAPILVAEFDADGPCLVGPPRGKRRTRAESERSVGEAGMATRESRRQRPEHGGMVIAP